MRIITYSLKESCDNSNEYYKIIEKVSEKVISNIIPLYDDILSSFKHFIVLNKIEKERSREEYFIELMLLGVFITDYNDYSYKYIKVLKPLFKVLNKLKHSKSVNVNIINNIKGYLINKFLSEKNNKARSFSFKELKDLISWLSLTGDFQEEVLRLNNWYFYLKSCSEKERNNIISKSLELSEKISKIGHNYLDQYLKRVDTFLEFDLSYHIGKEDFLYCSKSKLQYYFNMISAEIMNKVYKDAFKNCKKKMIFIPACMRQNFNDCKSIKCENGYKCAGCSNNCNAKRISALGEKLNASVYIIPHESSLFKFSSRDNSNIGIIGIACIVNLISGGFKAVRYGFTPQCVLLDYCGCKAHWDKEGIMTDINLEKIKDSID